MSTFTSWNGPCLGPSTKDITGLIDAYTNVASRVTAIEGSYLDKTIINDSFRDVNNNTNSINTAINSINTNINSITRDIGKITDDIDNITDNINNINSAFTAVNANIENVNANLTRDIGSITRDINNINSAFTAVNANIDSINSDMSNILNKFVTNNTTGNITGINGPLSVDAELEFVNYSVMNVGTWAATKLSNEHVFAGTYILGEVTQLNINDLTEPKHARAFIKYINSKKFDATVDIIVTKGSDNKIKGSLKVFITRDAPDSWTGLKFYLVAGTLANDTTPRVWLAMYSADLGDEDRSNLYCNIAGENFKAITEVDVAITANGTVEAIATAEVPDGMTSGAVIPTASIGELKERPTLLNSKVAIVDDIKVTIPIGAGLRWGAATIPEGYLVAGTAFNVQEYPELAVLYPDGQLPEEDNTIFLAKYVMNNIQ